MKRIFLLILPFNFSALSAVDFMYETSIALRNSVTKEYVYEGEKCISRLDWIDDVIPLLSFTGQAEFFNVILRARIDTAVPAKSGVIEMGFEVGVRPYNGNPTLNDVYGDFICGYGLDINLDYGIYITIPGFFDGLRGSKTLIRYGLTEKRYPIFP